MEPKTSLQQSLQQILTLANDNNLSNKIDTNNIAKSATTIL